MDRGGHATMCHDEVDGVLEEGGRGEAGVLLVGSPPLIGHRVGGGRVSLQM